MPHSNRLPQQHFTLVEIERPTALQRIQWGEASCSFGTVLLAWSEELLLFLAFLNKADAACTTEAILREIQRRFTQARPIEDRAEAEVRSQAIFGTAEPVGSLRLGLAGTPFQKQVWKALAEIESGTSTTYSALAHQIGRPKAIRAVASAVGANPLSFLLPCHRVLREDGGMGGYRWGLPVKECLLKYEAKA